MGGRIPESFIDDLLTRIDIVDIISKRVQLKRAGREYSACCPFHDEKTPSFTVSPNKQFYHCFGCGVHGTAIGFLMEYDGVNFVDAVEELAKHAGMDIPTRNVKKGPDIDLYTVHSVARTYYEQQAKTSARAKTYLDSRGLSVETCERFHIGYAPPGWENLKAHLKTANISEKIGLAAGLLTSGKEGKIFDRFRDRIMFPIQDRRDRCIAFGARLIDGEGPKYLNSPETELFHKGKQLYGLFECRQASGKPERILVVEGYMDVISVAESGLENLAATLGTATTPEHAELIFRNTDAVVFCFDGDRAGRQAAWRALESVLLRMKDGRQASFLFLPDGEDPDSLVRDRGPDVFLQMIDQAKPLDTFFFEHFKADLDLSRMDSRARLHQLASPLLNRIPESLFRDMMFSKLQSQVGTAIKPTTRPSAPPPPADLLNPNLQRSPIRTAIALLLQYPADSKKLDLNINLVHLSAPGLDILQEILDLLHGRPHLNTAGILEYWRGRKQEALITGLAMDQHAGDIKQLMHVLSESLQSLQIKSIAAEVAALQDQLVAGTLDDGGRDRLRKLMQGKQALLHPSAKDTDTP